MVEAILSFILVPACVYALGRIVLAHSEAEHGVPSMGETMIVGILSGVVLLVAIGFVGLMWWLGAGVWELRGG